MVGYREGKTDSGNTKGIQSSTPTEKHHRRSIRLKEYDYSSAGAYFITICIKERRCVLGKIHNSGVLLSLIGKIVNRCRKEIPHHFSYAKLDVFVVIPNHFHGIIVITNDGRGVQLNAPTKNASNPCELISPKQKTLSVSIRTFKVAVTTNCKKNGYHDFIWQRNYYERIIRNEDELSEIREYILYNPLQWQFDRGNPERIQSKVYDNQWSHFEEGIYGKNK
jgi:putative transposase